MLNITNPQRNANQGRKISSHFNPVRTAIIRQGNTSKKSNAGDITISNFKLYYKAVEIKTAWY
jgi:hypothetical protein